METQPTEIPLAENIRTLLREGMGRKLSKLLAVAGPADLADAFYEFSREQQ